MLNDWIHWISSIPRDKFLLLLTPLLVTDGARYGLATLIMCMWDMTRDGWKWLMGKDRPKPYDYTPSICVVIAGLNEGDTIFHTLSSLEHAYPHMETIVVDDGSTDGMSEIAQEFAEDRDNVIVLRKPERGGKSSALNMAIPFTQAEIIVVVDGDSQLSEGALWDIVQPFRDAQVGAVSGNVATRNPWDNLCTWLQGLEYRRNIFVGRMLTSRLGILGIISGAFGAFRRSALLQVGSWDVGPGEDGDLTLKLRKAGYNILFQPYAHCLTNAPTNFRWLMRQRRRWEWAAITFECRKHLDIANPFAKNFRLSNFLLIAERLIFNVFLIYFAAVYIVWFLYTYGWLHHLGYLIFTYYVGYLICDWIQIGVLMYYSDNRKQDIWLSLVSPLTPPYYVMQKLVTLWALTEELIFRRSFKDNFVPERVREVTWHW